jgi:hypothetical protein
MAVDPRSFHLYNVTDTCSVWNVLSSATLYQTARSAGCNFICTAYVVYECLLKLRQSPSEAIKGLRSGWSVNGLPDNFRLFIWI